ncbi:NADH-ubiquinone oxidoreductase-F iron-sulfur binding region domain-containing protein [Spirochaeta africana]|uniref:NADH:ubiquinone oxidoreductase, NADH-binding (51 kD) subunit n=1 Tax=Spirochaeta africana (strain ATCC 700263 / DSM 8902 / Z-7692) TaxID=889378 RepID=H9UJW5_SPIAZ|nr:NADH-ubiquinone oxidoreductase-F iron-sulfur binding region domain-containing protein [Spirochaeta africana]AFG37808.1 NADH:ubiquinone oxidoreductase, NADH-binding (51 kD) subunit [Spirochaeta africana DSM 8902]
MKARRRITGVDEWYDYAATAAEVAQAGKDCLRVCCGGGCLASGAQEVVQLLREEIEQRGLPLRVMSTGCLGPCARGPMARFGDRMILQGLTPERARRLIAEWDPAEADPIPRSSALRWAEGDHFFQPQRKIALRSCGLVDPERVESAVANGAYAAVVQAVCEWGANRGPQRILDELKASGLRGRGGAGFPTWRKWTAAREQQQTPKYVICNADEGDPGAFMDRSIIEGAPHDLIEGMLLAGFATGARQGFIYVRAEYPLAVQRLQLALLQAGELGLLGENILGTGFCFELDIRKGSGAFVCGEETALMASIEGRRGEPRPRPPFPAEQGLWDCPSLLNNVETYATVPGIIRAGAAEYLRQIESGRPEQQSEKHPQSGSRGTKVFALAGAIRNAGLVEVPIGTTLGELVYDIGGGIIGDKAFKAAQIGGPSGGCVPRENLNVPLDYESLQDLGAIMGSGGLIVMDEETCMVDVARYFLEFVQEESCGKCAPCRVGTKRMLEILERICAGQGRQEDLDTLIRLGELIRETALCGLGQTAPNPVLSTLRHFRHEYEQHIHTHHCAAGVCAGLVRAPCQSGCPAGVDVPGFVALVKEHRYAEALQLHRERNPFAAVCARVCFHTCEEHCRRASLDAPVAIRAIKRFMVDQEVTIQRPEVRENLRNRERRVAIVGAGPAGLSCAYFLARLGYAPEVFESEPRPGGMLVQTIPAYRLPREVLAREIRMIEQMGATIHTGEQLGRDFSLDDLRARGFEAVFLGVGAPRSSKLGVPGEELVGVDDAVEFLRRYNIRGSVPVEREVVVVGGGNAAVDAARTAVRLGAEKVTIVYRRTREQMPAYAEELTAAEAEGVVIRGLMQPVEVRGDSDGRVRAVLCRPMQLGGFDRSGRRRPTSAGERTIEIACSQVIAAIGQQPVEAAVFDGACLEGRHARLLDEQGYLQVDPATGATALEWLFAGGDAVSGPASVVAAIGAGERAAVGIDRWFTGSNNAFWRIDREVDADFDPDAEPVRQGREPLRTADPLRRRNSFDEVELPWSEAVATMQAARCLRCEYGKCRSEAASKEAVYV